MNYARSIKLIMILLITHSYSLYCKDFDQLQHTTKLIEFVKQQEEQLQYLQSEANVLMDEYIGSFSYRYGNRRHNDFYIRWTASRDDLRDLYEIQQQIFKRKEYLKEKITDLIDEGESFDEVDSQNHTALYYAQTSNMYNALRSSGAGFELVPFLYIYQWYAIPTATVLLFIMYKLYQVGYFSFEQFSKYSEKVYNGTISTIDDIKKLIYEDEDVCMNQIVYNKNDMHSRDMQGRTPLMNYLIAQEALLVNIRAKIDASWNDNTNWDNYYAQILQHKAMCQQTQVQIKKMVDCGAALDIQDAFGKTLLDCCFTKEIYEFLLEIGVPFQINSWVYFNYGSFVKEAPILTPVLVTSLSVAVYITIFKDMYLGDERDQWFNQLAKDYLL